MVTVSAPGEVIRLLPLVKVEELSAVLLELEGPVVGVDSDEVNLLAGVVVGVVASTGVGVETGEEVEFRLLEVVLSNRQWSLSGLIYDKIGNVKRTLCR
jgi:hypothetical protein